MKGHEMKMTNRNQILLAGFFALALAVGATAAYADKGAETLVKLGEVPPPAKSEATIVAHKCPRCTDSLVSVVDKATKGPNHLVSNVVRHNCKSCDTKITTAGVGPL